jgi:hypothetical protein
MSNRPQTLYALADSPVGLAAWMIDHDARGEELMSRVFDGKTERLTQDDILNDITLYWLTNTAVSSARSYWDYSATAKKGFFDVKGVTIPVEAKHHRHNRNGNPSRSDRLQQPMARVPPQ